MYKMFVNVIYMTGILYFLSYIYNVLINTIAYERAYQPA